MNLTILSLRSAVSTSSSPFFNTHMRVNIEKSSFSRHFSSILRTSNAFSLKMTKFSNMLDSAITLDAGQASYNRKLFMNTEKVKDEDCSIVQCNFYKCKSTGNGGAINFDCGKSCSYNIIISKSGFMECEAEQGGAFYIENGKITITEACFSQCKASRKCPNFYIQCRDSTIENVYIEKSQGPHGIYIECSDYLKYSSINHTSNTNKEKSFAQIISTNQFESKYISFEYNEIWHDILYLNIPSGAAPQFFNFNHDSSTNVIEAGSSLLLFSFFFIDQKCKLHILTNDKSVQLRDSAWSGKESDVPAAFPKVNILPGELNSSIDSIGKMEIKKSGECWLLVPAGGDSLIPTKVTYKIFLIIALVVLFIGTIFFCCKVGRRRYGLSSDKLAYTL
jgi:hypothetical protein